MEFTDSRSLSRQTVKKLDLLLLPVLSLLFLLNSLDRSNVGNVETANFTRDVGLQPDDLNTAVAWFFAVFVFLQPLGAAAGRKFGMTRWVPGCMAFWGLCTVLHIFIARRWQLITLRIVIAALEAGFYPTVVSYLSLFYTRYEFARRLGFFYGQSAVAGALGGLLSFVVFRLYPSHLAGSTEASSSQETGKWTAWKILFVVEGLLTMAVAILSFFWLPPTPGRAWFLRQEERRWAEARLQTDRDVVVQYTVPAGSKVSVEGSDCRSEVIDDEEAMMRNSEELESETLLRESEDSVSDEQAIKRPYRAMSNGSVTASEKGLSRRDIFEAITDWKIWFILVINICSSVPVAAFSVFLPLVVKGFNVDAIHANLLSVPPFVVGALVLWLFTWWSDKSEQRIKPILCGLGINLLGLIATVLLPQSALRARYVALCVLLGGSYIASPLTVAWLAGNIEEPGKRAIMLGINGWGNLAGLFAALLFAPRFAPHYLLPFYVTLCLVLFSFAGYAIFWWLLLRENARRRRIVAQCSSEQVAKEWNHGTGIAQAGRRASVSRTLKLRYLLDFIIPGGGGGSGSGSSSGSSTIEHSAGLSRPHRQSDDVVDHRDTEGQAHSGIDWDVRRGDERLTFQYSL
ncbi:MFS general substrate transporter [Xylona heveae TC161]|uniref:MFS general substrate transporter n=1 Tax=Xylona heveae (strain CBS 132557 / TC161) TaxID=1328760 RepID=A0A165HZJ0_XYLHT|nr:MFS general substrate transporter [Xylona heveae TC161]KZF24140.1 MFS general substrate transporter [Xylona heveae TC161]